MSHRLKKPKAISRHQQGASVASPLVPQIGRLSEYIAAQFSNTASLLQDEEFTALAAGIDSAYESVSHGAENVSAGLAHVISVCHQALFSALAAIARGTPLDGTPVTRRALEAANTALAISLDPNNAQRWLNEEARLQRWAARKSGSKPAALKTQYSGIRGNKNIEALGRWIGMLSDSAVHFTPEFRTRLDFRNVIDDQGDRGVYADYLVTDPRTIIHDLLTTIAAHLVIPGALDECAEGGFSRTPGYVEAVTKVKHVAEAIALKHGFSPITADDDRDCRDGQFVVRSDRGAK